MVFLQCNICFKNIKGKLYRLVPGTPLWNSVIAQNSPSSLRFNSESEICNKCYSKYHRLIADPTVISSDEDELEHMDASSPDNHVMDSSNPHRILPTSEKYCTICGSHSGRDRVTNLMRRHVWDQCKVVIPFGNRTCTTHLVGNQHHRSFDQCSISTALAKSHPVLLSDADIAYYLNEIITENIPSSQPDDKQSMDFLPSFIKSESDYQTFTGLDKNAVLNLLSSIAISTMRTETVHSALLMFMIKLRMGISQNEIAHLFNVSQPFVSGQIEKIRICLMEQFVPKWLGFSHMLRKDYLSAHSTTMSKILFEANEGAAVVILDGTYFEIEKSSNYMLQKSTYSLHKYYNLVKSMIVCAPDGYIIHVEDVCHADNAHNDSSILNYMIRDGKQFNRFFLPQDIIVVDRGFRDSVVGLENLGYNVKMPSLLSRGQSQFSCEEANNSRLVTKIRWVIESVNGRLKKVFKFLQNRIPNSLLPKIDSYVKISCAILNAYFKPLVVDHPAAAEMAQYVLERSKSDNKFYVDLDNMKILNERGWVPTNINDFGDFPRLDYEELRDITVGIFQLKQAPSYTSFHLKSDEHNLEDYEICKHPEFFGLLHVKMGSRHRSAKRHRVYVAYYPNRNDPSGISGYYCTCQVGCRTLGTCVHVASVLWLLGYALPNDCVTFPAHKLGGNLLNLRS